MFDRFLNLPTKWIVIITMIVVFAFLAFVVGVGHVADLRWPSQGRLCGRAFGAAIVLDAVKAPNGNILCKIIDADSVERSVWLDSEGVVLK